MRIYRRLADGLRAVLAASLLTASSGFAAPTSAPSAPEYKIKAAFLFNFVRFVEWPGETAGNRQVILGVVGSDAAFSEIRDSLNGRMAGNRSIAVRRVRIPDEVKAVSLLYVTGNSEGTARRFSEVAANRPVLTVTEYDRFPGVGVGSIVNFFIAEDSVRFAVDVTALERSSIKMSSQMLQFASIVRPNEP